MHLNLNIFKNIVCIEGEGKIEVVDENVKCFSVVWFKGGFFVAVRSRAFSVSNTDSADQGDQCDFLVPSFRPTSCTLGLQGGNGQEERLVSRSVPLPAWFPGDQVPCSELCSLCHSPRSSQLAK